MKFEAGRAQDILRASPGCTIKFLEAQVGGLSKPGKMPWYSYSIPAEFCKVGSKLRQKPGSVCASCYAMKGRYVFTNVQLAMERRYTIITADLEYWAASMVALLKLKARGNKQYFRWHDSGDIIDDAHLESIIWIARQLPEIRFWLPTKEYAVVKRNMRKINSVNNLVVRVSAPMVGQDLTHDLPTSSVGGTGYDCPAYNNGGKCGDCRACWDPDVERVNYPLH